MVQSGSISTRNTRGRLAQVYMSAVVALVAGWTWATVGVEITAPPAVALEARLAQPTKVAMLCFFVTLVVWVLAQAVGSAIRHHGAPRGDALTRVTDQPESSRNDGEEHPVAHAALIATLWPFLILSFAAEALQILLEGQGAMPIVAGVVVLAVMILVAVSAFDSTRQIIRWCRGAA